MFRVWVSQAPPWAPGSCPQPAPRRAPGLIQLSEHTLHSLAQRSGAAGPDQRLPLSVAWLGWGLEKASRGGGDPES